jgi:hypothetical protein
MDFGNFAQTNGNPRYRPLTIHQHGLAHGD